MLCSGTCLRSMDDVQNSLVGHIVTACRVSGIGEGNSIILNGCHAKLPKLVGQAGEGGFTLMFGEIN